MNASEASDPIEPDRRGGHGAVPGDLAGRRCSPPASRRAARRRSLRGRVVDDLISTRPSPMERSPGGSGVRWKGGPAEAGSGGSGVRWSGVRWKRGPVGRSPEIRARTRVASQRPPRARGGAWPAPACPALSCRLPRVGGPVLGAAAVTPGGSGVVAMTVLSLGRPSLAESVFPPHPLRRTYPPTPRGGCPGMVGRVERSPPDACRGTALPPADGRPG